MSICMFGLSAISALAGFAPVDGSQGPADDPQRVESEVAAPATVPITDDAIALPGQRNIEPDLPADSRAVPVSGIIYPEPVVVIARALAPIRQDQASYLTGPGGLTFSANVAIASEYRFRGVNLSGGDVALQGGFDVAHPSGFYVGTWASTLDNDTVGYGALELDLYGGWSGDVIEGLTANVVFIAYTYPDAPQAGDFDYYEIYGSLAFTLGPVSTTLGVAYDPKQNGLDFGGLQRDNLYTYGEISTGIPGTPFTVSGHVGYTDGALSFETSSKSWDWSFGVSMPVAGPLTASLTYIDAEADVAPGAFNPTSSTVMAKLSAKF